MLYDLGAPMAARFAGSLKPVMLGSFAPAPKKAFFFVASCGDERQRFSQKDINPSIDDRGVHFTGFIKET